MKERRGKRLNLTKLSAAAFLFSENPRITVTELADRVKVAEGTIYKWVKLPEWDKALDDLKFTGDRALHREWRDIASESGELVLRARRTYQQRLADGTPKHKLISETAKALDLPIPRVRNWAKRFQWDKEVWRDTET